jgi:hypothetical protein
MPASCPNGVLWCQSGSASSSSFAIRRGGLADHDIEIGDVGRIQPIFREGREWLSSHEEVSVDTKNEPIGSPVYVFSERKASLVPSPGGG